MNPEFRFKRLPRCFPRFSTQLDLLQLAFSLLLLIHFQPNSTQIRARRVPTFGHQNLATPEQDHFVKLNFLEFASRRSFLFYKNANGIKYI